MASHAKLSASGSDRWINCPGSVKAEAGIKEQNRSYAQEGTCAHELAELVLINGGSCFEWIGQPLIENNAFTVTQEMAGYVQEYVDYVQSVGGFQMHEQQVDYSAWVPEGFGTSDAICIHGDLMTCIDLKYGKGVTVHAEKNSQGMLYALGAYSDFGDLQEIKRIKIVIVQPRKDHISEWELSLADLLKWGEWVSQKAEDCLQPDAERVPGEKQCLFCKAKATCPALLKKTQEVILSDFDNLDLPEVSNLTDAQMRKALDSKQLVIGWLNAVEAHISERVSSGKGFQGYKLVEGRAVRAWQDEKAAAEKLQSLLDEAAFEKKLLSPAKAEKALGKVKAAEIKDLIFKPKGKPVLAREDDPRESVQISADDFD
ncbi:MAG: DUF2800 domain-containing protein [Methyloprofundus sp.]|nr:DUF2800 domain-containing protein [Methyloprofundus sp.]